jgi:hypothetical protein
MRNVIGGLVGGLIILAGSVGPTFAQDSFRHGRIRYLEPSVSLQRESETSSEEAVPNVPFLPGDRVWSDGSGRAEFQFADGGVLRLDSRGKLDYVAHEDNGRDRVVLKLWSGGLYIHARDDRNGGLEIETPGALVEIGAGGVFRLDVESGETRLSVYEGEASLASGGRRVSVGAQERTYARSGESPEPPRRFDPDREADDFDAWDRERQGQDSWADEGRRYLPEELTAYSGELAANGVWRYEASVGNVWQPYVGAGWSPYVSGRWTWTPYGWTWIPGESWGWAPSHYGRWGVSASFGWYWIPGRTWGPGWVSWASGGDYVGWCPLGRRDQPVYGSRAYGQSVYRGMGGPGWSFVRRGELGARDLTRRRVERADDAAIRLVDSPLARPTRDGREFRVVEGGGRMVPRAVRTRPTPGDTVPELRADRTTTIPVPRPRTEGQHYQRRNEGGARDDSGNGGTRDATGTAPAPLPAPREHATDTRAARRRVEAGTPDNGNAPTRTRPRADETPRSDARRERPSSEREADHEVLGRFFRPLNDGAARTAPANGDGSNRDGSNADRTRARRDESRPPDAERTPSARPMPRSDQGRDNGGGDRNNRAGSRDNDDASRTARPAPREERKAPPPRSEPRQDGSSSSSRESSRSQGSSRGEASSSSSGNGHSRSREHH